MCRFDTADGPVTCRRRCRPIPGWTLTVVSPQGDNIYATASMPARPTPVALVLVPSEEHFLGVTPEARGIARDAATARAPSRRRTASSSCAAPTRASPISAQVEAVLKAAHCSARAF